MTSRTPWSQHAENTLTPKQQAVLKHRLAGHSWRTIAQALNINEATARGHHKRALDRIRKTRKDNTT